MEAFYSIVIDKKAEQPLYQQLAEGLCALIEQGILPPNSKLPPIRRMASQLHVNTVTVVNAYKYLEQKKVVYSQVGSGTYVSPLPIEQLQKTGVRESPRFFQKNLPMEGAINFVDTSMPEELFPVREFQEAFDAVLEREKGGAFRYLDSMGYLPLRQILCQYFKEYGIQTTAEVIQIISGAQQGIDLISKALVSYGDAIFIERPTSYGAAGAFLSRGGNLIEIPLEQDGMNLEILEPLLKLYHPRFLYMMAYFQTPTGISYSIEKKRKLLELAEKFDFYLIEDDNLYDFYYSGEPIVPLKALDYKNRVIYIKSFSKLWMPGLRMGCMLLPKKLLEKVKMAKYITDISTSGFLQKAVERYLRNYGWQKHSAIMRQYCGQQYRMAISLAEIHFRENITFQKPEGGISLWLQLPEGVSASLLCQKLLEEKVIVSPGSQYSIGEGEDNRLRICFSHVTQRQMEEGFQKIAVLVEKLSKSGT